MNLWSESTWSKAFDLYMLGIAHNVISAQTGITLVALRKRISRKGWAENRILKKTEDRCGSVSTEPDAEQKALWEMIKKSAEQPEAPQLSQSTADANFAFEEFYPKPANPTVRQLKAWKKQRVRFMWSYAKALYLGGMKCNRIAATLGIGLPGLHKRVCRENWPLFKKIHLKAWQKYTLVDVVNRPSISASLRELDKRLNEIQRALDGCRALIDSTGFLEKDNELNSSNGIGELDRVKTYTTQINRLCNS